MCVMLGWCQEQDLHVPPCTPGTLGGGGGPLRPWCQAQHALTSRGQAGARLGEARQPEGGSTGLWERSGAREVSGGDWRDQGGKLRGRGTRGAQAPGDRGRGAGGRSGDQQDSDGQGTKPAKTKSYRPSREEGESGTCTWRGRRSRWGTRVRNLAPSRSDTLGTCATPPGPKGQGEAALGGGPGLAASATVGTPAALAWGQLGTIHGRSPRPACLGPPGPEVPLGQSPPGVPSEGAGWVPGLPLLIMPRPHLCPAPGGSAAQPQRPCRGTGRSQWRGEPTGCWPAACLPLPGPPRPENLLQNLGAGRGEQQEAEKR